MIKIRKPAAWEDESLDRLMSCEAGQAYVLDQFGPQSVTPEHVFANDRGGHDAVWYEIYEDGSLWYVNDAEDEVWADYADFIQNRLYDGIRSYTKLYWNAENVGDDLEAVVVPEMVRKLLLHYFGGDAHEAKEWLGCLDCEVNQ